MKKWVIAGLAMVFSVGALAETVTNNLDVQGGFIYNHGAIKPDDSGLTFTNAIIRAVTVSAGQLSGVDPETGAVITNSANLLPLKAQSVTADAFTGDGSGLTNLNAANLTGTISTNQLPAFVLQPANWGDISGSLTNQADLSSALAAKANASALAAVATSGSYADLADRPELAPIATNADFSNLTVTDGTIAQSKVNGLTNELSGKLNATWTTNLGSMAYAVTNNYLAASASSNLLDKTAASNALTGQLTVRGGIVASNLAVVGYQRESCAISQTNIAVSGWYRVARASGRGAGTFSIDIAGSNTFQKLVVDATAGSYGTGNALFVRQNSKYNAGPVRKMRLSYQSGGADIFLDVYLQDVQSELCVMLDQLTKNGCWYLNTVPQFNPTVGDTDVIELDATKYHSLQIASSEGLPSILTQNAVGIGTNAPSEMLHVVGNVKATGRFIGDGSSLTNLNVNSLTGRISTASLPTSGVWNASGLTVTNLTANKLAGDVAAMTNLTLNGVSLAQTVSNLQQQAAAVYVSDSSVTVQVSDNETTNGASLIAAYAQAKTLNPSSSNRVAVIVPPGRYDLGTDGLQMDTPYIDLVGLTTDRSAQYLFGAPGENNGVIKQSADQVHIENLTINSQSAVIIGDASDPAAYFPTVLGSNTVVRNCGFSLEGCSMRFGVEYAGRYEHCTAGVGSFGGDNGGGGGTASGTFIGCQGGGHSFGGFCGTASGTFIDCQGGEYSFGFVGTASGTFTDCRAGYSSFGSMGIASGTFKGCQADSWSFGGDVGGVASGTFIDCQGGDCSFGGDVCGGSTASGTFMGCRGGIGSFGGNGTASGTFTDCQAGLGSFGGRNEWANEQGILATNAILVNCTAGTGSFGPFNMAATGFNYNASGHTFAGGPITGDGSGLTNLNAANLTGTISTNQLPALVLQPANWGNISGSLTNQADLSSALAAKANASALAAVATSGSYNDLANTPVLASIATNPVFSNLTVADDEIAQSKVNGLTNELSGKLNISQSTNFVDKAANNVLSGTMTVQGAFVALYIPPQGGLSMGSFTNGLPQ